jgi:hypothetical protein
MGGDSNRSLGRFRFGFTEEFASGCGCFGGGRRPIRDKFSVGRCCEEDRSAGHFFSAQGLIIHATSEPWRDTASDTTFNASIGSQVSSSDSLCSVFIVMVVCAALPQHATHCDRE